MHEGQPIPVARHIFAMRLSYRLVGMIQVMLRPEDIHDTVMEFYRAIVQEAGEFEEKKGG